MAVRARNLKISKFASGYSLAVLADYFVPPYFPLYPYYNPNRAFWPDFRKIVLQDEKRTVCIANRS